MRILGSKPRLILLCGVSLALLYWRSGQQPRVLAISEVPLAFWAWRTQAPTSTDLYQAFRATKANTLFLRAGQFDVATTGVQRIRPASGAFPPMVELHLVYNATRKLLREWERLDADELAHAIATTYQADLARATTTQAQIVGLQLDFDAPTRLLPQYAALLHKLRTRLPATTQLSITGLPTWANARDLHAVLTAVDFWIPQCYGTQIPDRLTKRIPISSPAEVARTIKQARHLGKPFYAGLSAYSYAILYAKDGGLIELRGDLDPAWAAQNTSLALIERQSFGTTASEMRYVYRAQRDVVLDGLIMQAGDTLVFDLPSAETLRASARAVRENAGEQLLGICLFRLPSEGDETTLSVAEIAAAVTDTPTRVATQLELKHTPEQLHLVAKNIGTASAMLGDDALVIDLAVPAGSLAGVLRNRGFSAYETLCRPADNTTAWPCSERRANVIRLKTQTWKPNSSAEIVLRTNSELPVALSALVTTHVNNGRMENETLAIKIQNQGE